MSSTSLARRGARAAKDGCGHNEHEYESSCPSDDSGGDGTFVECQSFIAADEDSEMPCKGAAKGTRSYRMWRWLLSACDEYSYVCRNTSKHLHDGSDQRSAAKYINAAAIFLLLLLPALITYHAVLLLTRASKLSTYLSLFFYSALSILCLQRGCSSSRARKYGALSFSLGLVLALAALHSLIFASAPFLSGPFPVIEVDSNHVRMKSAPPPKVAIIGAGPSGMGALFALKLGAPSRDVTLFEATSHIGGHATTVRHNDKDIDIGFIFSSANYFAYQALLGRYGMTRSPTSLSVKYHGKHDKHGKEEEEYGRSSGSGSGTGGGGIRGDPDASPYPSWHNMGDAPTHPSLQAEIDRFQRYVEQPQSMLRMLMPLGLWLKLARFSNTFVESVLRPLLTPLFVTARGCMFQSAQATLDYFRTASPSRGGFLSINLDEYKGNVSRPVYHSVDGAVTLHENILEETRLPGTKLHLNTAVESVSRARGGKWRVRARPTSGLPGGRCVATKNNNTECLATGTTVDPPHGYGEPIDEEFDHVIMATSAKIASKILVPSASSSSAGIHWVLKNIDYDDFRVTLSVADNVDAVRTEKPLYHVYPNGRLAGSIDRILEVGDGAYKLEVEPDSNPERPVEHYGSNILATRKWHHHRFSLWELLLTHRVLPRFNHAQGLHIAGDFVRGYGHDDALSSGIMAACKAGVSAHAKKTLEEMQLGFLCNEIKE